MEVFKGSLLGRPGGRPRAWGPAPRSQGWEILISLYGAVVWDRYCGCFEATGLVSSGYIGAGMSGLETLNQCSRRYARSTETGPAGKQAASLQDFIAYLYSVIRNDEAMVRVLDRALKDRYGDD